MSISNRIAEIREAKGLTKADVAKILDMDYSNYHRIEGRDNKMTIEQLESIAKALGVSVIELLTYSDEQPANQAIAKELEKINEEKTRLEKDKAAYLALADLYKVQINKARGVLTSQLHILTLQELHTRRFVVTEKRGSGMSWTIDPRFFDEREAITSYDDISDENKLTIATNMFKESGVAVLIMKTGLVEDEFYNKAYLEYEREEYSKHQEDVNGPTNENTVE